MTGVTSYTSFRGQDGIAPVAVAIDHMGKPDSTGLIHPDYPWLNRAILVAILAGYASVILVMLMGQSRVFFSMSKDGLLPRIFSSSHSASILAAACICPRDLKSAAAPRAPTKLANDSLNAA